MIIYSKYRFITVALTCLSLAFLLGMGAYIVFMSDAPPSKDSEPLWIYVLAMIFAGGYLGYQIITRINAIRLDEKGIHASNILIRKQKSIAWHEISGLHSKTEYSELGYYKLLSIQKNGQTHLKISAFYYRNFKELKSYIELNVKQVDETQKYDKNADSYYNNLINALILFTYTKAELDQLAGPAFNPMTELETELDYAYLPAPFETIFRTKKIDVLLKKDLLAFKQKVDEIPNEIWDWAYINDHPFWIEARKEANALLDNLGISHRNYVDESVVHNAAKKKRK